MQQLSPRGRQWLKTLHMLFVCGWVGGAAALLIIRFIAAPAAGQADAHGIDLAAKIVDDCLIIPSALGSLFTGLTFFSLYLMGVLSPSLAYFQMGRHIGNHPLRHLFPRTLGQRHGGYDGSRGWTGCRHSSLSAI